MRYLATYCLLQLAGDKDVKSSEIIKALKAADIESKEENAKLVCT